MTGKSTAGFGKNLCWMFVLACMLAAVGAAAASEEAPLERPPQIPAFVPGELLVKFRAEVRQESTADYREWFGISTRKTFAINGYQLVKLPEGADIEEALDLYLEDPDVEHAEPNYRVHVSATTPDDIYFSRLWGLHNFGQNVNGNSGTPNADIHAPEAWDVTTGSRDVVVAVIDTGVDIHHPDLAANIWANPGEIAGNGIDDDGNGYIDDVNGWDFYLNDNNPLDANGHGTHVTGTIAAVGDNGIGVTGVGWATKIMALRFMDAGGNGDTDDALSAIEYAAAMGADIINNSWGGSGYNQSLKDAIEASGALVVCAAGNSGWNTDTFIPHYPSGYNSPNIVSVAASDQDDNRAAFSNYGPFSVDVAAPGTNIYSTVPAGRDPVPVWQDNFDDGSIDNWVTGGVNSTWGATAEKSASGTYSLTDSPGTTYINGTNSSARSPLIDLSNRYAARLEFKLYGTSQGGADFLWVEASTDLVNWTDVQFQVPGDSKLYIGVSGSVSFWVTLTADLKAYDDMDALYLRFRFSTDGATTADGWYIDDVKVTAASSYSGDEYGFKSGTSMATPHVSGLAALIKAHTPALTPTEIKTLILGSADRIPTWNGLVGTGGRINAASALAAPQISSVQVSAITETTAVVTWTTDKPSDSIVRYGTASRTWDNYSNSQSDETLVTSHSVTLSGLVQQKDYYFRVGSTDVYGNGPDNKDGDANPSAEDTFRTLEPDPPSIVEFPVANFAADTITVSYDESDMQGATTEGNYTFSPSMNFATGNNDIADLGGSTYRLSMASIPAYEVFTLTVSNITDLAGNAVDPASIRINDNDGDSMADDWEVANGLNPAINDSAVDPDADGYTNFQEYRARTHPRSAVDTPFAIKETIPGHNAGIINTQRVPNSTDFAILLESVHGIDTTNSSSVTFTIDDGVNGVYTRNLESGTVRFVKLTADPDNQVTRMWVVYERSQESGGLQNFPYDSNVNIKIDASDVVANDMVQVGIDFNVETEAENDAAQDPLNLPDVILIGASDPDLDPAEDGIQVDSGDLEGARVIFDSSETRTPAFGPLDEIPPLDVAGAGAVGEPLNLQPPTVFDVPPRIFIPCPGYSDVSGLSVFYFNGSHWTRASDAAGNVLAGGEGWMVPGSRVNHNETVPATIEIRVYHFSGAQAGTFSAAGGGGGGGGGCFITAASHGALIKHVLFYALLNIILMGLGIYGFKKIIRKP